jgi:GGDEF domain-containing protein
MENPVTPKNFSLLELDGRRKAFFFQDKLTGLGNRDALILLLKKASLTHIPATLVHLDIINFRHYNKMRGLAAGDDLLVGIGLQLAQLAREKWSIELHENCTYAFRTVADSFYLLYLGYATDYAIAKMNKAMTAMEQKYAIKFELKVIFEHAKIPAKIEFEIGYLL